MPAKRRQTKARARYPEPIEKLIAGEALEWSDENWHEMFNAFFFSDYDLSPTRRRGRGTTSMSGTIGRWRTKSRSAGRGDCCSLAPACVSSPAAVCACPMDD